jgi:hypothetical protein
LRFKTLAAKAAVFRPASMRILLRQENLHDPQALTQRILADVR